MNPLIAENGQVKRTEPGKNVTPPSIYVNDNEVPTSNQKPDNLKTVTFFMTNSDGIPQSIVKTL